MPSWKDRVDFRRGTSPPVLGWALLLAGAALLASGVAFWSETSARVIALQAGEIARDAAERKARSPKPVIPPTEADRQAATAARHVQRPWLQTLRLIETVTEAPVFLRSLSLESATGSARLEAEAPRFADALSYVRALNDAMTPASARLVSHAPTPGDGGGPSQVRFTVAFQWTVR